MESLTYLLVDFENLKPSAADVTAVRAGHYRLWLFHGPHQNKFDAPMVKAWQPLGDRVEFVQSSKQGKNALDFHIAFHLGALYRENKSVNRVARYVVVSGDGGFDALFDHMRSLGCSVDKAASIPEALAMTTPTASAGSTMPPVSRPSRGIIPAVKQPAEKQQAAPKAVAGLRKTLAAGDLDTVVADLRAHPKNRPGDRKALERYVVARLGNKITVELARTVIRQLEQQKLVTFSGKAIEYRIPKAKQPS